MTNTAQRAELQAKIWKIANEVGSVTRTVSSPFSKSWGLKPPRLGKRVLLRL